MAALLAVYAYFLIDTVVKDRKDTMKKIVIGLLLLFVSFGIVACNENTETHSRLEKLIIDVFDPQPGEQVLVMADLPYAGLTDHDLWLERREMAKEWLGIRI